jgi:protocatechuate 4,5-dioxygenase, beta chain
VKRWLAEARPDQIVIVYNDHLNHFTFDAYPTFALGVADEFPQADEGFGLRPFPSLAGDTQFGWHVANYLVRHEFDLTICEDMKIDHGIYSWLPYVAAPPWPAPVLPLAVNMVRHPIPTSNRLRKLGEAIRAAIETYPGNARVAVVATGGMSHQISGARFGMANEEWDRYFLAHLTDDLDKLVAVPQEEIMRIGGTEASELALWFAMRGALSAKARHVYDFYTFPQITGCGVIVLDEAAR